MPKILYLTYDGLTDPLGQSQILPYQLGLKKKGYDISIISYEKKENRHQFPVIQEQLQAAQINWIPFQYSKRPPIFSTLYDLVKLRKAVFRRYKLDPFDIIHCRSYLTALIGLSLKRKKGVPFVFDMRGFWADERLDGGIWTLKSAIYRRIFNFFKKKEKAFFSESDYIISLTIAGKKIIESEIVPNEAAPIKVIPCCVDNTHFDESRVGTKANIKNSLGIDGDKFILGYVGSIGTWYMLPEMMAFYKKFIEKNDNSTFLFVTKEDPKVILDEAQKHGVDERYLKIVSATRKQVPEFISIFDWSIFFIKPVFSKQASSPTKQGEIMSMGIPLVCNKGIGDTDEVVKMYASGVSISEFSEDSYQSAIDQIRAFKIDSEHIREGSIDFFSLDKGVNSYAEVYTACFSSNLKE